MNHVYGCKCAEIMAEDSTRHFRGCPNRETHPEDPAVDPATTSYFVGFKDGIDAAIKIAHQFQDIVGWQPGESRNALVGDIERAILKAKP